MPLPFSPEITKDSPETEDAPQHTSQDHLLACKVMERLTQKLIFNNIRKNEQDHVYWVGKNAGRPLLGKMALKATKHSTGYSSNPGHWVTKTHEDGHLMSHQNLTCEKPGSSGWRECERKEGVLLATSWKIETLSCASYKSICFRVCRHNAMREF